MPLKSATDNTLWCMNMKKANTSLLVTHTQSAPSSPIVTPNVDVTEDAVSAIEPKHLDHQIFLNDGLNL